eukprot:tig00000492_g1514.t1
MWRPILVACDVICSILNVNFSTGSTWDLKKDYDAAAMRNESDVDGIRWNSEPSNIHPAIDELVAQICTVAVSLTSGDLANVAAIGKDIDSRRIIPSDRTVAALIAATGHGKHRKSRGRSRRGRDDDEDGDSDDDMQTFAELMFMQKLMQANAGAGGANNLYGTGKKRSSGPTPVPFPGAMNGNPFDLTSLLMWKELMKKDGKKPDYMDMMFPQVAMMNAMAGRGKIGGMDPTGFVPGLSPSWLPWFMMMKDKKKKDDDEEEEEGSSSKKKQWEFNPYFGLVPTGGMAKWMKMAPLLGWPGMGFPGGGAPGVAPGYQYQEPPSQPRPRSRRATARNRRNSYRAAVVRVRSARAPPGAAPTAASCPPTIATTECPAGPPAPRPPRTARPPRRSFGLAPPPGARPPRTCAERPRWAGRSSPS